MRRIGNRAVSWLVAAAVTAVLSPVSMSFAAQNGPDTINSAAIIAADGISGQSLTTGAGVKTGHIQDGAVTASKLGIVCANGEYLQYVFGSGWVCSVGTAGPQGPVGATGATGAQGPQGPAGSVASYAGIRIVQKGLVDNSNTFNTISGALDSITDATADNRYLIMIMPGVYNENVTTKQYVAIKGAETKSVVITSSVGYTDSWNGTINVTSDNSPLENLTIENTSSYAIAVNATLTSSLEITNCIIRAIGVGSNSHGVVLGSLESSIINTDIKAVSNGNAYGISCPFSGSSARLLLKNSTVSAEGIGYWTIGVKVAGKADIMNSFIAGSAYSAWVAGLDNEIRARNTVFSSPIGMQGEPSFYAASSQINNGFDYFNGLKKLVNCYDGNYNPIPNE